MKKILPLFFVVFTFSLFAQSTDELISEIEAYQINLNEKFLNPETTILDKDTFRHFMGLEFYPIDLKYRVEANFVRTPDEKPFLMPTTTERLPEYVKYGEAHFEVDGKSLKLMLYKSTDSWGDPEKYGDHLFLPFTDLTSGDGSYGGGRFIDLIIPNGDIIIIDFNTSYNPYCAYNSKYSCPIPPRENDLLIRIEAGVMAFGKH